MKIQKQVWGNYTSVSNDLLNDSSLSAKAKWIYCYLYSKPENWDFSGDRIATDFIDGRKAIFAWLSELQQAWRLERTKQYDGKMIYIINRAKCPNGTLGKVPKRQSAEMVSINKKEILVRKNTKKERNIITSNDVIKEEIPDDSFLDDLPVETTPPPTPAPRGDKPRKAEVDLVIDIISKHNDWVVDWTHKSQRQFANHLHRKLCEVEKVKQWSIVWSDLLDMVVWLVKDDQYYAQQVTSPEKIYRNLSSLLARARQIIKSKQQSPSADFSNSNFA